jgi:outer membrane protein assembly factor BamB
MMRRMAMLAVLLWGARTASAYVATGVVFEDRDGDGSFGAGDAPLPGVWVSDSLQFVQTAADGHYSLDLGASAGSIVWVRTPSGLWTPDGHAQGFWKATTAAAPGADFPLVAAPDIAGDSLEVVQITDLHIGQATAEDNARSLSFTSGLPAQVGLVVATGDLSQSALVPQLMDYRNMMDANGLRYRSVPGNHDWYDGGVAYRSVLGPTTYSFDAGGRHFVVLNSQDPDNMAPFLERDLAAGVPVGARLIAMMHAPPWLGLRRIIADHGAELIIAGHWHTNRIDELEGISMVLSAPLAFGGLDFSPPGFRRLSFGPLGLAETEFVPVADQPVAELIFPPEAARVAAGPVRVSASVYGYAGPRPKATVQLDDGAPVPLPVGGNGWVRAGEIRAAPGAHRVTVTVDTPGGPVVLAHGFEAVDMALARVPMTGAAWPQFGGGPERLGRVTGETTVRPPLVPAWVYATGGSFAMGGPVVWGPFVYAGVIDHDGNAAGVVCVDGATGTLRWFARTPKSVRHAVAVDAGIVVAMSEDGAVVAFDAMTGMERWRHVIESTGAVGTYAYQAPLIADGVVYVGVSQDFVALNLADGSLKWKASPEPAGSWLGAYLSPTIDRTRGVVLGAFARAEEGLFGYSAVDGKRVWTGPLTIEGTTGTPAIDSATGTGYLAAGDGTLYAFEVATGRQKWHREILPGNIWTYSLASSLAIGSDRILLSTQKGEVVAVAKDGSSELWRKKVGPELSDAFPFADGPSVGGSPVLVGDVAWVGGMDGVLYALDAKSGRVLWQSFLGAPTLSTPAISGDALFIGAADGTIHAFMVPGVVPGGDAGVDGGPDMDAGGGGWCNVAAGRHTGGGGAGAGGGVLLVLVIGLAIGVSRRSRSPGTR